MSPQARPMGGGLSGGELAGVIVGPTLFVLLIFIVVHVLLILLICRRSKTKKSTTYLTVHTSDRQFGGHYHAYAESSAGHSYEDPDDLSSKQPSLKASYREKFPNRMVCNALILY